ncbi:hypothetical protein [Vibrio vulnificus YJ016]|uniref:Uncharacterized protein n=1 Tax=Vibrio vulnificus (strain YJ016) TaxID=196600 RepID=Q7MPY1_VIBVY|nr:hypothetical protein [Vibrio vulnificus YJ016]
MGQPLTSAARNVGNAVRHRTGLGSAGTKAGDGRDSSASRTDDRGEEEIGVFFH